jgi:hypothetical protein
MILPNVLHGCETWSFTLREEYRTRVFENRVHRNSFRLYREVSNGEWTKQHNHKLHDLYFPPNIMRVTKSKRMRRAEHVARMGREEIATGFWYGNLKERNNLEDLGVDGRIILKCVFKK